MNRAPLSIMFIVLSLSTAPTHGMQENNDEQEETFDKFAARQMSEYLEDSYRWVKVIHPPEDPIWLLAARAQHKNNLLMKDVISNLFLHSRWGD